MMKLVRKQGPLYSTSQFKDTKDPCPVFDGTIWHIFGSGGSVKDEKWKILHAISPNLEGAWVETDPVTLSGLSGDHVAAPGVIFDKTTKTFHMFIQTDFLATNGTVEYLISHDSNTFTRVTTALQSIPETEEAGIYDPHPAVVKGKKFLVYSGTPRITKEGEKFISKPDIFLAISETNLWEGPWKRLGKILDHRTIAEHHNQPDDPEYEWGIEGPQLLELPNGQILLNATCFLPQGKFGTRQRTFFALADTIQGPYRTLGPVIHDNFEAWESGENGHAACILQNHTLHLFYQARPLIHEDAQLNDWRYGIATFDLAPLIGEAKRYGWIKLPSLRWRTIIPHTLYRIFKRFIRIDK